MKSDPALLVFGDQPTDKERFFRIVRERDFPALRRIDRDFVAIVHFPGEDVVVTSGAGVQPYFIGHGTTSTVHGRTIAEVAAQISSGWEWDYHALGEYLSGALVTEGRTFHRGVRRLGRGRFVTIPTGCVAQEIRYAASPIDTSIAAGGTNAGELVEALLADLAEIARRHPCLYLSASGGFDSRVLLAAALRLSLPIRLLVSGGEGTTDRVIVEAISAGCRLDLRAVSLKRDDFLRNFVAISEATGGGLALDHWYGFLHLSHIGDPNAAVLMGVGGEVCRSHYFDRGIESLLLNCVPSSRRLDVFRQWLLRRGSVGPDHIEHLAPPLAAELRPEAVNALATHHAQLAAAGANDWLDGLDRFFVEQEIAYEQGLHFLGIEQIFAGRVVAPFTHGEFIRGARGMRGRPRVNSHLVLNGPIDSCGIRKRI